MMKNQRRENAGKAKGNIIKGYDDCNKYPGGWIILKIFGYKNLTYINVNDPRLVRK